MNVTSVRKREPEISDAIPTPKGAAVRPLLLFTTTALEPVESKRVVRRELYVEKRLRFEVLEAYLTDTPAK